MRQRANITVIGADKTGVVARVTNYLFEQHGNIEALEEQVTRGQFSMTLQASWTSKDWKPDSLRADLERMGRDLGMEIKLRYTEPRKRQRFAILVTRESHCLEGLLQAVKRGTLKADPAVVVGNRKDLARLAEKAGLPFVEVPWNERTVAEKRVLEELEQRDINFVVLARFMKILSPNFVWRYKNKIINIHPSLLPSFPGPQAYRQAYEHGVKIVGVTAHFVSMHLDEGPIIAQASFSLRPNMTLKDVVAAGQRLETTTLVKAVQLYLAKRLDVYWGIVKQV